MIIIQVFLTLYEMNCYLRVSGFVGLALVIFNFINLVKVGSDKYFLTMFKKYALRYNLQADLTSDYTPEFDLRYKDRYAMFFIMIIRAGNAFMFITLPLIFFYKIRFLPKMN